LEIKKKYQRPNPCIATLLPGNYKGAHRCRLLLPEEGQAQEDASAGRCYEAQRMTE